MPFGCVHFGHPQHNRELWLEFLAEAKANDAYLIGMGDYRDLARTHFRAHVRSYQGDEESVERVDDLIRRDVEEFAEFLKPHSKRIMGMIEGNHGWKFIDGTTDTQYLCQILGVRYLGLSGWIRLYIRYGNGKNAPTESFLILCHHGMGGGGAYIASDVGKFERQIAPGFEADIYLSSHTHRKVAVSIPQLSVTRKGQGRIIEHPRLFAKTGCFKKAYCEGPTSRSYEEQKLFHPSSLGWVNIYIDRVYEDAAHLDRGKRAGPVRRFTIKHEY